jgi:hypothetical protein
MHTFDVEQHTFHATFLTRTDFVTKGLHNVSVLITNNFYTFRPYIPGQLQSVCGSCHVCCNFFFKFSGITNKMELYTICLFLQDALHVSGGSSTHHLRSSRTVHTASDTCQAVTAIVVKLELQPQLDKYPMLYGQSLSSGWWAEDIWPKRVGVV